MAAAPLNRLREALRPVLFGQDRAISQLLVALLAGGHVLLEGVPGVAKTLLARSVADALGLGFKRVQFTPDLMPSDILGTHVFHPAEAAFRLVKGPVFTEVLVADEINRTPPKTQAALLEAMEERQVTLDGESLALPARFFVVATQNPLELEGTYPLPEAQLDRFALRVRVGYPDEDSERAMLAAFHQRTGEPVRVKRCVSGDELDALQAHARSVRCEPSVLDYALRLVRRSREEPRVKLGASPRATQLLLAAAKAHAALQGTEFVTPDDVKAVAEPVLGHRLQLKADAEVEGLTPTDLVGRLLEAVPVPR